VIHLRNLYATPNRSHPNRTNTFFATDPRYRKVQEDFHEFLSRNPNALEAFNRLPTNMTYYKPSRCRKGFKFMGCNRLCMPEKSENLPECVVLEFDARSALISKNWELYTSDRARFVVKANCLI
jgi:hypothetical protein